MKYYPILNSTGISRCLISFGVNSRYKSATVLRVPLVGSTTSEMTERRRLHRELVGGGAEKIQDSCWKGDKIEFFRKNLENGANVISTRRVD